MKTARAEDKAEMRAKSCDNETHSHQDDHVIARHATQRTVFHTGRHERCVAGTSHLVCNESRFRRFWLGHLLCRLLAESRSGLVHITQTMLTPCEDVFSECVRLHDAIASREALSVEMSNDFGLRETEQFVVVLRRRQLR